VALLLTGCAHAQTVEEQVTEEGTEEVTEEITVIATTEEPMEVGSGDEENATEEPVTAPPPKTTVAPPNVVATTTKRAAKKPVTQQKSGGAKKKKGPIKVKKLVLLPSKQQIVIKLSVRKSQPQASKNKKKSTKLMAKSYKLSPPPQSPSITDKTNN
jgi:hypothetical protein